ncbi:MAG: hypothetical protein J0H89_10680 [Rhizobiales bacterium]|nr:hypothetical protein [Hyphomicrobiales bacterium]
MKRNSPLKTSERSYDSTGDGRDIDLLEKLATFDALFSYQLRETRYDDAVITRLIKGHYIGLVRDKNEPDKISKDAYDFARRKNVYLPLMVWPRGEALLATKGRWPNRHKQADRFDHRMYRVSNEFSLWTGAKAHGLTFDFIGGVLADDRCPPATRNADDAHRIPLGNENIVPDTPIIRVRGAKTFCAHIEHDMGTERMFSAHQDSIESKVRRYVRYLAARGFRDRYALPNVTILFFFNQLSRHKTFPDLVKHVTGDPEIQQRFASMFQTDHNALRIDEIDGQPKTVRLFPPATGYALENDYQRVAEPLNILTATTGASDGRAQTPAGVRPPHSAQGDRHETRSADGRKPPAGKAA